MFSKSFVSFVILAVLSSGAQARMRIVERNGRALYGRRFGQENPAVIGQLSSACEGQVCGVLAGQAISTLLAASPECAQQDMADDIIDAARKQTDPAVTAKMIELAKTFRQAEKNTPPDFTTNPPTNRNSVFCQTPPRNSELVGLNQAQDPANDPNIFFDPATKSSVTKGSQANTEPLGGGATSGGGGAGSSNETATATATETAAATATESVAEATATTTDAAATTTAVSNEGAANTCPAVPTVTVTVDAAAPTATETSAAATTDAAATATDAAATSTDAATPTATAAPVSGNIDLGSCTDPTIRFGAGIEGRKETSFIPNNTKEFAHGSAQNSAIITQFICDTFVNSCKANQAAKDTCTQAKAAAAAAGAKKGAAADAFNAAFGVTTNFAAIQALDDQGRPVA